MRTNERYIVDEGTTTAVKVDDGEPMPKVGGEYIIHPARGKPKCVIVAAIRTVTQMHGFKIVSFSYWDTGKPACVKWRKR